MPIGNSQATGQALRESTKDNSTDESPTTLDRLRSLEKDYNQLSALFQNYLAESNDKDTEELDATSVPACEITRLSAAEWRTRQDLPNSKKEYSLLTVGPKCCEESSPISHCEIKSECDNPEIETPTEHLTASALPRARAYRAVLNGRAELMVVLGGIFNLRAAPGLYMWMWPFKYLVKYEKNVRARSAEEESKLQDGSEPHVPEVALRSHNESSNIINGEDRQPRYNGVSQSPLLIGADSDESGRESKYQNAQDPTVVRGIEGKVRKEVGREPKFKANQEPKIRSNSVEKTWKDTNEDSTAEKTASKTRQGRQQTTQGEEIVSNPTPLRDELRRIVEFMDNDMKDLFQMQKSIEDGARESIAFDFLWLLFKPGDLVITRGEQTRAYVVLHVTGGRALDRSAQNESPRKNQQNYYVTEETRRETEAYLAKYPKTTPFVLDCFCIDFDGTNFGPLPHKFMLAEYEGEVSITSLEVFPARFAQNFEHTKRALIKRGKRFVKLAKVAHKYYSGKTIREPWILENQGEVHGEIMIDFALAVKQFRKVLDMRGGSRWDIKFGTGVIANPTAADQRELSGSYRDIPDSEILFMEDPALDNELRTDYRDRTSLLKERPYSEKLPDEVLILLPLRVYGFSLHNRTWHAFDITKVQDIEESGHGFENLVLSKEHKKIVQALVQNHKKGRIAASPQAKIIDQDFSMDLVRGKGKGLIILLHGVPGTGKTSTAECVAVQTKRPLFPVTCGDIGTQPAQVEERLNEYFDMAHKWGCVLLLDEADVFLAQREKGGDLVRNGVVSVFLRVLEYYAGILILTTNRIGEFDEAFSSRVHVKLYYPKLDKKSALEIWKMNMRRIADSGLDITIKENEIKKFAKKLWADSEDKQTQRWNGRQIRNAFQSAIALARWDYQEDGINDEGRPVLSVQQFEVVSRTSSEFDNYISTMHGIDEANDTWETIAARELLRKNDTPRKPISRSTPVARARGGRKKVETSDEDSDSDSDENEEEMTKLKAKLDKLEKRKGPSSDKAREDNVTKKSLKVAPQPEKKDEELSSASDESD